MLNRDGVKPTKVRILYLPIEVLLSELMDKLEHGDAVKRQDLRVRPTRADARGDTFNALHRGVGEARSCLCWDKGLDAGKPGSTLYLGGKHDP